MNWTGKVTRKNWRNPTFRKRYYQAHKEALIATAMERYNRVRRGGFKEDWGRLSREQSEAIDRAYFRRFGKLDPFITGREYKHNET